MLPESIINRKKSGFVIPLAGWLRGRLNPLVRDMLATDRITSQGLFNPVYVQKLLREHESGKLDHAKTLWSLFVFQMWMENFGPSRSLNAATSANGVSDLTAKAA